MKRRLIRWGVILLTCIVVAAPVGIFLNHWMDSSSNGSVNVGNSVTTQETTMPKTPEEVPITTSFFTASLPGSFVIKRQVEPANGGPTLLQFSANTDSRIDRQFAITIGTLPSDGLAGIADYHLRASDTVAYSPYDLPHSPAGAVAFRTTSGPAGITVFWPHGSQYAELAFSTDGTTHLDTLEALYSDVLNSWNWK
jgi:hypothetical protein